MSAVVRVESLSKKYVISHQGERYLALRDVLTNLVTRKSVELKTEDFWALRDVSLEIREGERLGIIGRNGAGKSTFLKILSRITEPSAGRVTLRGRVASLLEVGTGFHPELTGRENIYLNGAILGMSRVEIRRRFDEIVAFAEVERFLDTPVKRYSSGMYVRLAFSVAAHLEPDILVVDEVLAVGDAQFQKKCIGRMDDVARSGRTVIFVSHNMETVLRLCTRAVLLKAGRLHADGSVESVITEYLRDGEVGGERTWPQGEGNGTARLLAVRTRNGGDISGRFSVSDAIGLEVDYEVLEEGRQIALAAEFVNMWDQVVAVSFDRYVRNAWGRQAPHAVGRFRTTFAVPENLFTEGEFSVNLRLFSPPLPPNESPHARAMRALQFVVVDPMDGGGARGSFPHAWGSAPVRPLLETRTERFK